jgi:non-ribosomal peptide synthetase component F
MMSAARTNALQMPFNIQCLFGGNDRINLSTSLSLLLHIISKNPSGGDPIDDSLPMFMCMTSILLFRYTLTSTIKLNVMCKGDEAGSSIQKLEVSLTLSPDYTLKNLLEIIQAELECSSGTISIRLQDVLYIQVHDLDNESPEIVQMSQSGGLFLQFINTEGYFMTTFSFENLLSATYPLTIDIKSHWSYLLNSIIKMSATEFASEKISKVNIIDDEERNKLLNVWAKCDSPNLVESLSMDQPLLHNLFERQARLHPNNSAIQYNDDKHPKTYSYEHTNILANDVANYLFSRIQTSNCVKSPSSRDKDIFIGHFFPRCAESYVAMLGILKCGAAYVPLDPAYPMDRISYILTDCQADFVITTAELGTKLRAFLNEQDLDSGHLSIDVLIWDEILDSLSSQPRQLTDHTLTSMPCHPRKPCYVIYTSGWYIY